MPTRLTIACLCGAVAGTVAVRLPGGHPPGDIIPLALCHCNTCRHTSGVLCTSYCPIEDLSENDDDKDTHAFFAGLTAYAASPHTARYFCRTCGCHVFRRRRRHDESGSAWDVATGVIRDELHDADSPPLRLQYTRHDHVAATGDGGLAVWLPTVGGQPTDRGDDGDDEGGDSDGDSDEHPDEPTSLPAACHCGTVRFTVLAPDGDAASASRRPHAGFPDLLVPFATTDPAHVRNPHDAKWWLRPPAQKEGRFRYLAGTCACQTCRLATGFEIQTWAFVPRANIRLPGAAADQQPLTFPPPPDHHSPTWATYCSRPDVERNFCPVCGATVFWHDTHRPDLVDVSVGLLRGTRARAESLLDWCTTRVSFAEEATRGRSGTAAQRAATLIRSLGDGMANRQLEERV